MYRHFLVIAGTSRVARFFIKKAMLEGHTVTALCRASSDEEALIRMENLLSTLELTPQTKREHSAKNSYGKLYAYSSNVRDESTYINLLLKNSDIDSIVSFVGPTENSVFNFKIDIYTATINALLSGMSRSRVVEFYFHSSVGSDGRPGKSKTKLPEHYSWIENLLFSKVYPVFKNVTKSENILARSALPGLHYIIFRPDALTDQKAKRSFMTLLDDACHSNSEGDLKNASKFISREDVAEEMLRVATLPLEQRKQYFGHALYLVDKL